MKTVIKTIAILIAAQALVLASASAQSVGDRFRIGTLAPEGTNHDLNTKRYILFHKIKNAEIVYYDSFLTAATDLKDGKLSRVIMLPAHPDYKQFMAQHVDAGKIYLEECFQAPNHGMGLLKRRGVTEKNSVAFMPVTKGSFDSENYKVLKPVRSNVDAGFQLMAGVTDWAYTFTSFARRYPSQVEIVTERGVPQPGQQAQTAGPSRPANPLMGWQVYSAAKPAATVTACRKATPEELAFLDE